MNQLTQILSEATSAVNNGYFHLHVDGGGPVYRERVYCYELYHQMRLRWPDDSQYYLNGEVDKTAHPILCRLGAGRVKPDLLVHQPGYMTGNHAVIEVKSSKAPVSGIKKDLKNLSLFVDTVGYKRAIYLIYGFGANDDMLLQVQRIAEEIEQLAPIELWIHSHVNQSAIHCATVGRQTIEV